MARIPDRLLGKKLAIHFGPGNVQPLLERQNPDGLPTTERSLPRGRIGIVGGATLPSTGSFLVCTGIPIRAPETLDLRSSDKTIQSLTTMDGAFIAVHWSHLSNTLTLVTDRLGLQPGYLRHDHDGFTVVSDTRALPAQPDVAAWGSFFALGHTIGERTLASGLTRLPSASIIRYFPENGRLTVDRYWEWPSPSESWRTFDFVGALADDITQYAAYVPARSILLLSGGLDSRLLLCALTRARQDIEALVVSHPGELRSADSRYAIRAAKAAGVHYRQIAVSEPIFSRRCYLRYLEAMDAAFPTLDLFIPRVASILPDEPVWDGLMPDYLFSAHRQLEGGFRAHWEQEVRKPGSLQWQAVQELFHADIAEEMWHGFREDYAAEAKRWPQDEFGLAHFMLHNRGRNRPAMNPLKAYARYTLALTPGASANILYHSAGIPVEERAAGRTHMRLLRQAGGHGLSAPIISGGSPIPRSSMDLPYWGARLQEEITRRVPHRLRRRVSGTAPLSSFIGDWLIEPDDERWIQPGALDLPPATSPSQARRWKLLFYWKAWQWTHQGTLHRHLAPKAID